jgi:hypothetical protein
MADAASSTITITEQTGAKRTLTLRGAGLPKQGANWPGAQRVVTTWYAGNAAQASQHVLGPVERQSQWTGEWNTTRLIRMSSVLRRGGAETEIVFADVLRQVLEDMFRGGSLLRVEWATRPNDVEGDKKIVREGRATEWDFQYARIDDITWTCTWDWIGRGDRSQKTTNADSVPDAGELILLAQRYQGLFSAINDVLLGRSNRQIPKSATKFSLGQLEALVDAPSRLTRDILRVGQLAVSRAKYLGDIINKGRNLPFEIANQAVDLANTAITTSNLFVDQMSRQPAEKMALQANVAMVTRNASYFSGAQTQANAVSQAGVNARKAYRQNAQGDTVATGEGGKGGPMAKRAAGVVAKKPPLAMYQCVEGDTLISVSMKFYGTDSGAYSIAFSNSIRVTDAVLNPGRILFIPHLNAGRATSLAPTASGRSPVAPSGPDPSQPGGLTPAQGGGPQIIPPGNPGPFGP